MTPLIRSTVLFSCASLAAVLALSISLSNLAAQDVGLPPPGVAPAPTPEGMEVLTRGIVHEAFAEVVTDPKPGLVVSKRPPEAIEEVPPEFKPEDEGVIWITGYWAWDDERDDFFWQSGVWRVPPPGMRWVAGYWNEAAGGFQWVSGFWVSIETDEIRYYTVPPASLEAGPTGPSPGDEYFWATGSWNYHDTGYRWQPGYWAPYQENWVWISARYVWTPAGCVFLPGRWDHRLTRRGCLFAPVYFTQPIYTRPNYVYRPWCALNTPNLFVHLWVRPNYGHFYFGNYYGANWGSWGVTPWCQYRPYRNCYDPVLTQLQCHYRQSGVNYIGRLDGWHNHYASHVGNRPPRTWNEQVRVVNNININNTNITNIKQNLLAVNLQDASKRNDLTMKFTRLDDHMQKQADNFAKETRDVRKQRISVERPAGLAKLPTELTKGNDGGKNGGNKPGVIDLGQRGPRQGNNEQVRMKLPTTIVADAVKQNEKHAPPKLNRPDLSKTRVELPSELNKNRDDGRGTFTSPRPKGGVVPPKVEVPIDDSKNRDDGRGTFSGSRPKGGISPPKVELPSDPPRTKQPRPMPKLETPNLQPKESSNPEPKVGLPRPPKVEVPLPKPNKENPIRQPRVESPRPQPRLEVPQPKVEAPRSKVETPRERPQIKLDIPKPAARMDPAPRNQPTPRVQSPKPDGPKPEPRRGGENQPRGRNRKE